MGGPQASVSESRRQAILEATIEVVGRKGYRAATVADAIKEAGASRATFYKHFADKHDCFLTAYDLAVGRVLSAVENGCRGDSWLARAQEGLCSIVMLLASHPELARTVVVEAVAAGVEVRQRQLKLIGRLADRLEHDACGAVELPGGTALMAVSAVNGLVFEQVQRGCVTELPARLPELLFALLVPFVGPDQALEEMRYARLRASMSAAASPDSAT